MEIRRLVLVFISTCIIGWMPLAINGATDPNDGKCLLGLHRSRLLFSQVSVVPCTLLCYIVFVLVSVAVLLSSLKFIWV